MADALRLFLIEDEDDIAFLIRKSLERVDYQVTHCRTAAAALIVLRQTVHDRAEVAESHCGNATDARIVLAPSTFDLILLDQKLPDQAGLDLLQTLTREGISVPVIMMTAHGDEQLATRVLRAGALDYVVKDPGTMFLIDLPKRIRESVTRYRLEHMNGLLIQSLESARDGIMITDLQGRILKVNHALEKLTGYTRQELEGQLPRMLKSPAHPPEFFANMWRTILGRHSWQGELTNRRKDGTLVPTSMTISPIVDAQGRLTHFVGIQRDMTEQKRLERQLLQAQKMQSVGTLAGGVAHEFNNLLAGINGYAALGLREAETPPTAREFFQHVVNLSERAATLTRQLLTFARKPTLMRQRTVLPDLLRATADLVRHTLHIEVDMDLQEFAHDGGSLLVDADANQLQQALVNLALNARDAIRTHHAASGVTATEAIAFRVRPEVLAGELVAFPQRVPPGDYVLVEVEDCGSGMSPEVLNQALDPFFTTKEVGQGTGLGLPMVFGIVQAHQGSLTIESSPGRGTCVRLFLPRLPLAVSPTALATLTTEVQEPERTPTRSILVVDDEQPVLDVVRRFLQIAGHHVSCVTNGQEGLNLLASNRDFDLIILDLMMPREDPVILFERIRQRRPGVPVLLCTGLPEADPVPELLRRPGVDLIRKPFRMNELWYAVNEALRRKAEG